MTKFLLISVHAACAAVLLTVACSHPPASKLQGKWRSKDGLTLLKITEKAFITDDGKPIKEDYFTKGDTIFTSFEGNQPYTRYLVQTLDDHNLKLMGPDSTAMDYSR